MLPTSPNINEPFHTQTTPGFEDRRNRFPLLLSCTLPSPSYLSLRHGQGSHAPRDLTAKTLKAGKKSLKKISIK